MSTMPYPLDDVRRDGRFVARFAHQLTVASTVPVGSRWCPVRDDPTKTWQIAWWNCPTVALMRYLAADLAGSVVGVAIEDLQWNRMITPEAFALTLITNVRASHAPLGKPASCGQLMAALEQLDHPQRGTSRDLELARRLARLGDHREHGMVAFSSNTAWPGWATSLSHSDHRVAVNPSLHNRRDHLSGRQALGCLSWGFGWVPGCLTRQTVSER